MDSLGKTKRHSNSTRCTVPEVCTPLVFSGESRKGVSDIRRRQPREEQKGPEGVPLHGRGRDIKNTEKWLPRMRHILQRMRGPGHKETLVSLSGQA